MKKLIYLLSFLPLALRSPAQMTHYTPPAKTISRDGGSAGNQREGMYGGISLGYFHYNTHWYYHDGSGSSGYYDNYAAHNLNRTVVSVSLEKKAFRRIAHFDFDLGGELLLGPFGKTKAPYLSGDNTISSSGWAAGLNVYGRAVYRPSGQDNRFFPFAAIGPQYMFLHNNGRSDGAYASEYGYSDGWNEGVILMNLSLGVEIQLQGFTLAPQLSFGLFGWNSSSWTPHGRDVTSDGSPGFIAFSLHLSKKL